MTKSSELSKVCIVGGAGFIGSHFVDRLLANEETERVTIYDDFSSGRAWHFEQHRNDSRLAVVEGEVQNREALLEALAGHSTVVHLASNPDIARAATDPTVDFDQGTLLTERVVESMRRCGVRQILYASGSGVYGDVGELEVGEDYGPTVPISTYAASKLAGEALIAAYCSMFNMVGRAFRFANVVGPRQTHGVGFDFIRRLIADPEELPILGNGLQKKSYIAVSDVVTAVLLAAERTATPYAVYNVATHDHITVREIAELAVEVVGTRGTRFVFTGGDRGWKGDVPIVRLKSERIRALGWENELSSLAAMRASMQSLAADARAGRI